MAVNKKLLQGATAGAGGLTPSEHFGVVLYEGDGSSSHSINGGKFGAGAYMSSPSSNAQYIALPNGIINGATGNISVSFWMNTTYSTAQMFILTTDITPYYSKIAINTETNGKLRLSYGNASNAENNFYTTSTNLLNGNWHHIAYTLDIANTTAKIYVNGSLETTNTTTIIPALVASPTLTIGNVYRSDTSAYQTNSYKGKLDQFRFFHNILSASQVSTLYAETAATVESLDPLNVDTTDTLQVLGDSSCVALYKLENNEDDKSGNYDGTGTQVQYAAGRYGQGAIFSDSDSKINIPDNFGAESETVSYSLWFKTTSANGSYMFAKRTGNNTFHIRIDNSFSPAGKICVNNWAGTAQSANNAQSTNGGYNDGGWHHFVFTYDGNETTKTKCFIDGVYDSGMDWTYDLNTQSVSGGNNIGNYDLGSSNFSGTIDQVRVFNKTLSAAEVTTLYNENPLVASYRFEGNSNDDMRTYNGTDSNVTYEYGLGFTPDFVWLKQRDGTAWHTVIDSTRGGSKRIVTNSNSAQTTDVNRLTSFDTGGFTLGTDGDCNGDGKDFVAWCFKANGGTTSSNTDGSITSTVQTNTDAGFSIVKYDGANISGSTSTVGHNLGAVPELIIVKTYETGLTASEWFVYSQELGNTKEGYLNQSAAFATDTGRWNSTSPTSSVFTLGSSWSSYPAYYAGDTIAYCFHSVENFSSFGSYTGNGSDNGPIVETGFEPAFVIIKKATDDGLGGGPWQIHDNKRDLTNPRKKYLLANSSNVEAADLNGIDFLSNGFQIKDDYKHYNSNGTTFIYMAFAADPDTEAPTVAKSFAVKTYTGTGAAQSITGTGFLPNLVWIKDRDTNFSHALTDSVRGVGNIIKSNSSDAQSTDAQTITSFDSDGFSIGTAGGSFGNNGDDYVAWTWKADDNEPTIFGGPAKAVYKFEDNANDVTGTYNGNASNVSYVTGNFNKAASFNGSNSGTSGVVLTNLNDTLAGNSFSISLWVNCSSTQTGDNGEATIIGSAASSGVNGFDIMLKPTTGYLFFNFGNPNNDTVSTTDLRDDTWHHIVFTYTSSQALLYLDGNLLLTENSPNSLSSITNEITLGKWATGNYYALTGKIDQLRIYNGVVSDVGVAELYAESTSQNDDLELGGPPKTIISANSNAGFSIVKYTGTGVNTQILHGLSAAPELIIAKNLDTAGGSNTYDGWPVYSSTIGNDHILALNSTGAKDSSGGTWGSTSPTSTVFTVQDNSDNNKSGDEIIAYCFHSVSGYSKISSYVGNGSTQSITGLGFQPDWIMIKNVDSARGWQMFDSVRGVNKLIFANNDSAESSESAGTSLSSFDSDGFTVGSGNGVNESGDTLIYMAIKIN